MCVQDRKKVRMKERAKSTSNPLNSCAVAPFVNFFHVIFCPLTTVSAVFLIPLPWGKEGLPTRNCPPSNPNKKGRSMKNFITLLPILVLAACFSNRSHAVTYTYCYSMGDSNNSGTTGLGEPCKPLTDGSSFSLNFNSEIKDCVASNNPPSGACNSTSACANYFQTGGSNHQPYVYWNDACGTHAYVIWQHAMGCRCCNCEEICFGIATQQWVASGTGRERQQTRTWNCNCNNSTCSANSWTNTNTYRCASGYYGAGTTSSLVCTQCPKADFTKENGDEVWGTSPAGSTAQTDCYVQAGTYKDDVGTFNIEAKCPWK